MSHDFTEELPLWSERDAEETLNAVCERHGVDPNVLRDLVRIEREHQHRGKALGIYDEFDAALSRIL